MDFLIYNGLLSAISSVWKKSILNSIPLNNIGDYNFTYANVTSKTARKSLCRKCFENALKMKTPQYLASRTIDQFLYIKIQLKTIDLNTWLWGITTMSYFPEPRAEVYCVRLKLHNIWLREQLTNFYILRFSLKQ